MVYGLGLRVYGSGLIIAGLEKSPESKRYLGSDPSDTVHVSRHEWPGVGQVGLPNHVNEVT